MIPIKLQRIKQAFVQINLNDMYSHMTNNQTMVKTMFPSDLMADGEIEKIETEISVQPGMDGDVLPQSEGKLKIDLTNLRTELAKRDEEISNLKMCLLDERRKMKNILEQNELKSNHLDEATQRIEVLLNELKQCRKQLHMQFDNLSRLEQEWKANMTTFAQREENLTEKIQRMESEHNITISNFTEKYLTAKITTQNYKKYSTDKERHIEREGERIKTAYEDAIKNLKKRLRTAIQEHETQAKIRLLEMQAQRDAVLETQKST